MKPHNLSKEEALKLWNFLKKCALNFIDQLKKMHSFSLPFTLTSKDFILYFQSRLGILDF